MWFLYVLRCADDTLYTGVTTDRARRLAEHNAGRGSRYTAGRRPVSMIGSWSFADRAEAQAAEAHFRRQSRAQKLAIVADRLPFLGSPFHYPD
ncbi:MAG: GIY-YIG nuclease family protein [Anaerolineales bacterium]|nr:MAG: GIY-YIG nuclease family protein [Anaerolineales bacterium]